MSKGYYRYPELDLPDEERYWSKSVPPSPNPLDAALQLLKKSIEQDAIIVAIGPFTNLCLLDLQYPGILKDTRFYLMGGYVFPIRAGFPQWGNEMDRNIQVDVQSAKHVIDNANPILIPLTVTVETALRRIYLDELRNAGSLGKLIS